MKFALDKGINASVLAKEIESVSGLVLSGKNQVGYINTKHNEVEIILNGREITSSEADAIGYVIAVHDGNKYSYIEKRQKEYPDYREYLDGIVKGDQVQIQKYIDDCKAVKVKYPKL